MEEIQAPKKERKFLKAVGNIAKVLANELVMGIARKFIGKAIDKVGNKRQGLAIALVMVAGVSYACIDSIPYPITGNKQRLGWQTSGNGLVYRGTAADTVTKPSNYTNKDIKAYLLVDTVNNVMYSYIASKGGWKFNNSDTVIIQGVTMPFDSITFNTAKDGTVTVGEVEYNDTQGSLIQGLKGGLTTNVIGQQLHQRVNNRTGATLTKGTAVYLSGSQGNRITVAKALATSDPTSANTFGIVAESINHNQSGYVITEGLITNINTSALVEDSAVYLSPTVAGGLTSTKPQAPQHNVYIGVCVKSNLGSGELFVSIKNGLEITELHDVRITSPVDRASLYYKSSESLWRDTTAALLTSDTASMLIPYLRKLDTVSLSNRINLKLNISDTASMLTPYFKDADTTSLNLTSRFAAKLNISDTASMLTNYLRSGMAASTYLPLTGGTLTGGLTGTTANFLSNVGIGTNAPLNLLEVSKSNIGTSTSLRVTNSFSATDSTDETADIDFYQGSGGGYFTSGRIRSFRDGDYFTSNAQIAGGLSFWTQTSNAFPVNGFTEKMRITSGGSVGIGTITPSATFEVHGSAIFNGGSVNSDFRVESDGNANMVFVDASTDRVGIGTNAPTKTLDVNGEVKIATVTAMPTALLGKDGSNVVGELGLGTGMSVGSGILSVQAAGASATGLVTSFGSQTFGGNKTFNGNVNISTGTLDVGSTGTFGGRVKTNWLERNYAYSTSSSFTVSVNTTWQDINTNVLTTLTLPDPATYPGKELHLRQTGSGSLQSASSNIIPFQTPPTGSTSTAILLASTHEAVTLVSDGTNWIIMQRSEN